jgi:prepilin-type N-terminal cleavage/methylation domain-containing protein
MLAARRGALAEARPRSTRGFTLIELLLVSALASVMIAAAVGVYTAMLQQRRRVEQTLEIQNALNMAQGLIDYDVFNAGWRFPASAFSVRVINNVGASPPLTLDGLDTGSITTTSDCGFPAWGLVPDSDVLELAEGYAPEATGIVESNTGQTSFILRGSTNPLTTFAANPVVMFSDSEGNACLARVTSATAAPASPVDITMLAPDFSTASAPATLYPACPAPDMRVFRLGRRARYMVCRNPTTGLGVLFRQVSNDNGAFGIAEQIQDGIDDFQVGLRLNDRGTITSGTAITGTDCNATPTTRFCYCNVSAACGGTDLNSVSPSTESTVIDFGSHEQWVRQLVVGLTSVSVRQVVTGGEALAPNYLRPALLDHPAATGNGTGRLYLSQQHSVAMTNLSSVTP